MYFFNLWLQIRFPLKYHWQEIYHFMNAHTLALLISRVCVCKHISFFLYWSTFYVEGSLYIHLTMSTCFILLRFTHICIFQHWRNKYIYYQYHLRTHCGRLTHTCVRNLTWHSLWWWHVVWSAPSHFLDKCRFMILHMLISEFVSVYGRSVVSLLSGWVRDCRSAVGYDSSIVLMIGFQWVSCRLSISLKSGDSIPNLTGSDPDMNPTGFKVSSATLSVADSWPIHLKFCVFVGFVSVWPVWLGYKHAITIGPFYVHGLI